MDSAPRRRRGEVRASLPSALTVGPNPQVDPGPFIESIPTEISSKILGFLGHRDLLTLRGVSISFRAFIDYTVGLDVVANDHWHQNSIFLRRILARSLALDFITSERRNNGRTFLKQPERTKELQIRCSVPRPILQANLPVFTNLVRIGLKGRALTAFEFFPADENITGALAFPFRNLESLSLEINFDEWVTNQATAMAKDLAWENMIGYLKRTNRSQLKTFSFEFLDGQSGRNELPLVNFISANSDSLRDLSVKINFNRTADVVENPDKVPDELHKLCLHLGSYEPTLTPDIDDKPELKEKTGFGPFWTDLVNYSGELRGADLNFEHQKFDFFLNWSLQSRNNLRVVKLFDLAIYGDSDFKPKSIDLSGLSEYLQLEELHLHHTFFNLEPKRDRTPKNDKYYKLVKGLVRREEFRGLAVLTSLPNLRKVALWGFLTRTSNLSNLLSIKKLESLDVRSCGIRGIFGIGRDFFEKLDVAPGRENLPQYLGLKDIRIEDVNNDEIPRIKSYYQGGFARQENYPVTGQILLL